MGVIQEDIERMRGQIREIVNRELFQGINHTFRSIGGFHRKAVGFIFIVARKHLQKHRENEFAVRSNHINGIEAFWSSAKRRLAKFNGVHHHTFYLHLKECEFRFNHRERNLYFVLLRLLREKPL